MLPGRVERSERELNPHWLRIAVGGVEAGSGYLRLCSIVAASLWAQEVAGKPCQDSVALLFICVFFVLFLLLLYFSTSVTFRKMSFSCNTSLDGSFPPSPTEDRSSNRLSWGSLLQRLAEVKGNSPRLAADDPCSRSETGE